MIRKATPDDIPALEALEAACFDSDRMTHRSFLHMVRRAHATLLVDDDPSGLRGYILVLYNRATALGRLYSIAVSPAARGQGVARALLAAAEEDALENNCVAMRCEIRADNKASSALFLGAGYRPFTEIEDYYEDHERAIRYERDLVPRPDPTRVAVPFYEQTLPFTCGPACLMMALRALDPSLVLDRSLELHIWREATTIFMTSGLGGCGPHGLAIAAHNRGATVEVFVSSTGIFLIDSVRSTEKKEVMTLVENEFLRDLGDRGVPVHARWLSVDELEERFHAGGIPVVLISSFRIYEERSPHWVVVTGFDPHFIYVHDPFIDRKEGETEGDSVNLPIARKEFEHIARYGRSAQRACLILSAGDPRHLHETR